MTIRTIFDTSGTLTVSNGGSFAISGVGGLTIDAGNAGASITANVAGSTVTLPTTGVLATIAGAEALTGKSINGLTVTTSTGVLTIAAGATLATSGAGGATLATGSVGITITANVAGSSVTLPTTGILASQPWVQAASYVYAVDTGTANTMVVTLSPVPGALAAGLGIRTVAAYSTTGATTINVNSLGPTAVTDRYTTALGANSIIAGSMIELVYDGTRFRMLTDVPSHGLQYSVPVTTDTVTVNQVSPFHTVLVEPAAGLAELTIALPATPRNAQTILIKTTQNITSLLFTGGTLVTTPAALVAGQLLMIQYVASKVQWYTVV